MAPLYHKEPPFATGSAPPTPPGPPAVRRRGGGRTGPAAAPPPRPRGRAARVHTRLAPAAQPGLTPDTPAATPMPALFTARAAARATQSHRLEPPALGASSGPPAARSQSSTHHSPMPTSTSPPRGATTPAAAAWEPRARDSQVMRVVSPAITHRCSRPGRTPRVAQPMARMTVSRLQAAANTAAVPNVESHCIPHLLFRPFYSDCEAGVHGVAFAGGVCYTLA